MPGWKLGGTPLADPIMITRRCALCSKELIGCITRSPEQEFHEPPDGAVVFTARGNYGSRVFDGPARMLELYVCDGCLIRKAHHIYHVTNLYKDREEKLEVFSEVLEREGNDRLE